jgi:hypothetical protein
MGLEDFIKPKINNLNLRKKKTITRGNDSSLD